MCGIVGYLGEKEVDRLRDRGLRVLRKPFDHTKIEEEIRNRLTA